jgi:hypothetical protein
LGGTLLAEHPQREMIRNGMDEIEAEAIAEEMAWGLIYG